MNQCSYCGSPVSGTEKFCTSCGAALAPAPNQVQPMQQAPYQPVQPMQQNQYDTQYHNPQMQSGSGKMTGTALGAFICSIVGFFIFSIPLGIVSISLGTSALNHIKNFPKDGGKGLAIAGIVIGIIEILLVVAALAMQK